MAIYFGLQSKKYTPLTLLAKGGEGEIFTVQEDPSLVIKFYKDTYDPNKNITNAERKNKLIYMVKNPPQGGLNDQIAWPLDVLSDSNGIFVGFVMKKIGSIKSLSVIYEANIGTRTKSIELPWSKKIKVAKNLCSVVFAVHKAGHTIGDFNPLNIGINIKTLKVVLMDTDSYHIETGTQTFRCGVGKPEYVPAEIQQKMSNGNDLKNAPLPTFTLKTDYFALAIHIFKLLMGTHPYTLSKTPSKRSVVKPNMEENILQGQTAFFNVPDGLTYPKYSPPAIILPQAIQDLFIRAFITGTNQPSLRPTEEEWYNALALMEKDLSQCASDPLHQYPSLNQECPWCKVKDKIKETVKEHPMPVPKTPASGYVPSSSSYSYGGGGPSVGEWIIGSIIGLVILFVILALIFGIFGLFNGGFSNFFPSVGSGFIFIFDVFLWIFNAILFVLEVIWIILVWLFEGVWFVVRVIWDIIVWIFGFLINQVFPLLWTVTVWLWNGFWFLLGLLWDGLVWLFMFTFTQAIPFLWNSIVWLWNGFWFLMGGLWDITVAVISWVGNLLVSIFNGLIGLFS